MKNRNLIYRTLLPIVFLLAVCSINCSSQIPIPSLKEQGTAKQFIVDGKPFIALSGELGNNSATNIDYMKPIWPLLIEGKLNSVIAGISWAMVEPEEGKYNFDIVGALIDNARINNIKLIFIWFASWKNGMSSYIPDWVKSDYKRFPRVKINDTETIELLTPLSDENRNADAHAFAALMKYIKKVDSNQRTVIMIQVENEVGVLRDTRDRSALANEAYNGQVPQKLMSYIIKNKDNLVPELKEAWKVNGSKMSGTWEEVFGPGKPKGLVLPVRNLVPPMTQKEQDEALVTFPFYSDEVFMAWYYSSFINYVVEAGKAEYPIPMYVNAWLKQREHSWPGTYPGGGPLPQVFDIWHAGGPSIDILAPDLYRPDFAYMTEQFTRSGNPLFIPETSGGAQGAANVVFAVGQHNALGFSPFYIERSISKDDKLKQSYDMLSQLMPLIGKHQGLKTMGGVLLTKDNPMASIEFGDFIFHTDLRFDPNNINSRSAEQGAAIFIMTDPGEFYIGGSGMSITFSQKNPEFKAGLATVEEGTFIEGKWIPGRRLAGDDTAQGNNLRLGENYNILRVTMYSYK
jgi:beta-galactosidase GanA